MLGKIGQFFIPSSGHTDHRDNAAQRRRFHSSVCLFLIVYLIFLSLSLSPSDKGLFFSLSLLSVRLFPLSVRHSQGKATTALTHTPPMFYYDAKTELTCVKRQRVEKRALIFFPPKMYAHCVRPIAGAICLTSIDSCMTFSPSTTRFCQNKNAGKRKKLEISLKERFFF